MGPARATQHHPHGHPFPLSPFSHYSPVPSPKSSLLCRLPLLSPRSPQSRVHASSLSLPPKAGGAATAEGKGEERGAMRMLSKACSIVASSLPRCSSSATAPTVASRSLPLSSRLPFSLDKRWFSAGVWIWDRGASAGARHRDLQLSPCERNNTGVFARETLVCIVISGTHNCLFITVY
jgi:hypothetical protein